MALMYVHGFSVACRKPLSFNADRVPSIRVEGVREPLCEGCFHKWNKIHRTDKGLELIPLNPDAYEPQEVP